jgi:plastocyanin
MRSRTAQIASVAASLVLLTGAEAAMAADYSVTATPNSTFAPATVTVTEGDSVTWSNGGGLHNVFFDDGSFAQPPNPSFAGWTVSRTFGAVGSFTYYCVAHVSSGMTGTVNVTAAAATGQAESGAGAGAGATPAAGQQASGAAQCISKRDFAIRLRGFDSRRVRTVLATLNGKPLPIRTQLIGGRLRHTTRVDLRGLPRGTYTVAITVTTKSGRVLRGIRTYRTCAGKLTSSKLPDL